MSNSGCLKLDHALSFKALPFLAIHSHLSLFWMGGPRLLGLMRSHYRFHLWMVFLELSAVGTMLSCPLLALHNIQMSVDRAWLHDPLGPRVTLVIPVYSRLNLILWWCWYYHYSALDLQKLNQAVLISVGSTWTSLCMTCDQCPVIIRMRKNFISEKVRNYTDAKNLSMSVDGSNIKWDLWRNSLWYCWWIRGLWQIRHRWWLFMGLLASQGNIYCRIVFWLDRQGMLNISNKMKEMNWQKMLP